MNKNVHWARLVQDSVLMLTTLLKLAAAVVDLLSKAVNCRYASQF
jgi:hypothetical protein